jgi:hypothetical protein
MGGMGQRMGGGGGPDGRPPGSSHGEVFWGPWRADGPDGRPPGSPLPYPMGAYACMGGAGVVCRGGGGPGGRP